VGEGTIGTYELRGSGQLSASNVYVGYWGPGTFTQSGGTNTISSNLIVGNDLEAAGTYSLSFGLLSANIANIGYADSGVFIQTGGTNAISNNLSLGSLPGSSGTYDLAGGLLTFSTSSVGASLTIGDSGSAVFHFGNANGTGTINEVGSGCGVSMTVRNNSIASGTLQGWGSMALSGTLTNNGRIMADGYGTNRTLDLSTFSSVGRTITNTGNNGYFAQNHGKLALPLISVATGSPTTNWGQSPSDATTDLVNSVHLAFTNVTTSGSLNIALLATDRTDVPAFSGTLLDVWDFEPCGGLAFGSANLTIRYDDALAARLGVGEDQLHVYHLSGGGWDDVTSSIDTTNNWISANGVTSFSMYAVGVVPEPSAFVLLGIGVLSLLPYTWRRYRR
jgi:hypothetical protein